MRCKIPECEYDNIANLYNNGLSKEKIEKMYRVSNTVINRILKIKNVTIRDNSHKRRVYDINENYFDKIDSENKAYILGLLYSDGCNYRKNNIIKLELQEKDKDILFDICKELDSTHPIKFIELNKKNPKWQNTYRFMIANKHMSEQLEKLGMIPNKSLVLTYPKWLSQDLFPHFLRGYLDGDGHIEWGKQCFVTIAGTLEFCEEVQRILEDNYNIRSSIYNTGNKDTNTRILNITTKKNIYNLLHLLYYKSKLHINRKYDLYLQIYNEMNNSLSA